MLPVIALLFILFLISCTMEESSVEGKISDKHGGILRSAYYAPTNFDPAFLNTTADIQVARQWLDFLVYIGADNQPDINRSLAESWKVDEAGTSWTFELRRGVLFHDGKEFTSRDVKFTFDRLRDPDIGATTVTMYANIQDITTPDDHTVVFDLKEPNPDFLKELGYRYALIVDADNEDFDTNWNGTGPFMIEHYEPEDSLFFKRNPDYWMTDEDGHPLPYLEGIEIIFLDSPAAQVEALRKEEIDYLIDISFESVPDLQNEPKIEVYKKTSNTKYVIRMRSDRPPADDVHVRQALKAGTDRGAILEAATGGLGVTGRDTPIGPVYGDYYLDVPELTREVDRARELLAEAGYEDGLEITLFTQETSPVPDIAATWKEQMSDIGVEVDIRLVSPEVYFYDGLTWMDVNFGITQWGFRHSPQPYLDLAYKCGAEWNESHWCDEEIDELAELAAREMDHQERVRLYHEIQEIFIERGPIIVPFFINNLWAAHERVKGLQPVGTLVTDMDLRSVYIEE